MCNNVKTLELLLAAGVDLSLQRDNGMITFGIIKVLKQQALASDESTFLHAAANLGMPAMVDVLSLRMVLMLIYSLSTVVLSSSTRLEGA